MEKVVIAALVDPGVKKEFQRILIEQYGHVSSKISPTVEEIIKRWIKEQRKTLG